ncbi:hypothetical protein [Actinoallomurus sp. CA-142502]|uniref:hypothetical protein n=1 Tax=Actinoallomurus sp. CA-142502 TaxID=3239885 RepID=UPI003D935512
MKSSSTVVFDSAALRRAASGIDLLLSRVAGFEQAAGQAAGSLAETHPWGLLGEVYLREGCTSMMNGFGEHLRHMNDALTGARDRIARSADTYSAAGEYCLDVLNSVREDQAAASGALRQLNPASRFYNEHRILNGAMIALPYPLGSLGSSTLDGVRFIGDLTSGDPYNISTDLANLGADATQALFEIPQALIWISRNPLDYLVQTGITFLLNAFYWTKYLADCVTGDPIATGQAAYNYDSLAQGCHQLAKDLTTALNASLANGNWHGAAADAARDRLTMLRDGIDDTGRNADQIASLLQLTSSIMGAVEGIVKGTIAGVIFWAVKYWMAAQLVAAGTGGTSEIVVVAKIHEESAEAATRLGRLIKRVEAFLAKVAALLRRLGRSLQNTEKRAFTALRKSPWGEKFLNHKRGGQQPLNRMRQDNGLGKHAVLEPRDVRRSIGIAAKEQPRIRLYDEYGLGRYRVDMNGELYPGGRSKTSPVRYSLKIHEPDKMTSNYAGVVFCTARSVLPFGRAIQYKLRADDAPPGATIDRELDALDL